MVKVFYLPLRSLSLEAIETTTDQALTRQPTGIQGSAANFTKTA
ncbi:MULTISPECIES: hypothetical protein [Streptomyces]|nr:hypothetical protein [Streptomyces sp. NEAU-HV9]